MVYLFCLYDTSRIAWTVQIIVWFVFMIQTEFHRRCTYFIIFVFVMSNAELHGRCKWLNLLFFLWYKLNCIDGANDNFAVFVLQPELPGRCTSFVCVCVCDKCRITCFV